MISSIGLPFRHPAIRPPIELAKSIAMIIFIIELLFYLSRGNFWGFGQIYPNEAEKSLS